MLYFIDGGASPFGDITPVLMQKKLPESRKKVATDLPVQFQSKASDGDGSGG
jgi:hypothetical protein